MPIIENQCKQEAAEQLPVAKSTGCPIMVQWMLLLSRYGAWVSA
jgi:hypothetical protein